MHAVFNYLLALSLTHFLTKRQRVLSGCAGPITLCENTFPCFRLNGYSFDLSVCHMAPGQSHHYIYLLWGEDEVLHPVAQEGCGHANGHEGPVPTTEANLALFLLYVS